MRNYISSTLLAVILAWSSSSFAGDKADPEIQYLLEFVSGSGCTFVRNGDNHDSADAADHLRLKYDRGARHVNSAEQFIDRLASESSWTGKPYTVTCDGKTQTSGEWLHQALADHRQQEIK